MGSNVNYFSHTRHEYSVNECSRYSGINCQQFHNVHIFTIKCTMSQFFNVYYLNWKSWIK